MCNSSLTTTVSTNRSTMLPTIAISLQAARLAEIACHIRTAHPKKRSYLKNREKRPASVVMVNAVVKREREKDATSAMQTETANVAKQIIIWTIMHALLVQEVQSAMKDQPTFLNAKPKQLHLHQQRSSIASKVISQELQEIHASAEEHPPQTSAK